MRVIDAMETERREDLQNASLENNCLSSVMRGNEAEEWQSGSVSRKTTAPKKKSEKEYTAYSAIFVHLSLGGTLGCLARAQGQEWQICSLFELPRSLRTHIETSRYLVSFAQPTSHLEANRHTTTNSVESPRDAAS